MTAFPPEARFTVYPFTRQPDGDEVIIGRPDTATFLALPPDALEVLDALASGQSVSEAQAAYQAKWGELPEMDGFLDLLKSKGFLWSEGADNPGATVTAAAAPIRYHFTGISQETARRFFSPPAMALYLITIGLALIAMVREPWLVPGVNAIYFERNMTLMILLVTLLSLGGIFIHEFAHLMAARAVGIPSRMGISNRLWVIVAETDMTGVWQVPRERRYLPILAGPMIDAFSAGLITLAFFADSRGWLTLAPVLYRSLQAMWFGYAISLIWQCFLFVRTDLYYVIVNYFGCRDLMRNTERYLRNAASRFLPRLQRFDLSNVPKKEMTVVRWYAWIWVGGRALMIWIFVEMFMTVGLSYYRNVGQILRRGYGADPSAYVDLLLFGAISLMTQGVGLTLWIRSMIKEKVGAA